MLRKIMREDCETPLQNTDSMKKKVHHDHTYSLL